MSVDRVDTDRICKPYQYFKTTIYENRFILYKENSALLTEEVINLERNANSGKVDHPDNGRFGSKDQADAVCGAIFNASKHAEEFGYEFGESANWVADINEFNLDDPIDALQESLINNQVKNIPLSKPIIDFGMGEAEDYYPSDGIILF
ncbi:MAG: hypothetical protein IJH65_03200 [Methanobrevibacter sp.]|nr:hypothetical protein [Methanobrevibacter sp.]